MEVAKVTSKGQITIPKEIRELLDLETGSKVLFNENKGQVIISKLEDEISQKSFLFKDNINSKTLNAKTNLDETEIGKIEVSVLLISEFAKRFHIKQNEAERYLYTNGGLEFFLGHYDYEHTLSIDEIVDDVVDVCFKNGGTLK